MALFKHIRLFVIVGVLTANAVGEQATAPPAIAWLRGSGKDLEICLKGEIVEADGRPEDNMGFPFM